MNSDDSPTKQPELDPLLLAEQLSADAVKMRIAGRRQLEMDGFRIWTNDAWDLFELGICTDNEAESSESIVAANHIFDIVGSQAEPTSVYWFRSRIYQRSLPVIAGRKFGLDQSKLLDQQQAALGDSISELLPLVNEGREDQGPMLGILGELGVSGLFLQTGQLPYQSSYREGNSKRYTYLNHDSYVLVADDEKLPIEIKNRKRIDRPDQYDESKIFVINYFDVCRRIGETIFLDERNRPGVRSIMVDVADAIARAAQNSRLNLLQKYMLILGADDVNEQLKAWKEKQQVRISSQEPV